jgi:hypothetical protein
MFYLSDETAVKLHTDLNGDVWYAAGINPPENSNHRVDEFLLSPVIARLSTAVRVIGVPQNAELIAKLYLRKHRKELANICLAGPNICASNLELADPVATIFRMRDVWLPLACGGWREMTNIEYAIYALLARLQRPGAFFDKAAQIFYRAHPMSTVLSFIAGISDKDGAMLLTTIIDPRWYVDRRRFDNPLKLHLYLGLTPRVQRRVSDTTKILHRGRDFRCSTVLRCWKTQDPANVDFNAPENFLWRIWRSAGEGVKGDLRASQALVNYLYRNWLDATAFRNGSSDNFLMIDRFFKTPAERQAFIAYLS